MKSLSIIIMTMTLTGCAGMGTSDAGGTSGMSYSSDSRIQSNINRPDSPAYLGPKNIYFGGPS